MRYLVAFMLLFTACQSAPPDGAEWVDDDTIEVCGIYHVADGDTSFMASRWPTQELVNYMQDRGINRRVKTVTNETLTKNLQRTAQGPYMKNAVHVCHHFTR